MTFLLKFTTSCPQFPSSTIQFTTMPSPIITIFIGRQTSARYKYTVNFKPRWREALFLFICQFLFIHTTVNDQRRPERAGANFNGKSFDTDPARTNALILSQICWINRAIWVWVWHAHFYWSLVWQESGVFKERLCQHLLEDTHSLRNEGIILPTKYRWNDNTLRLKIV